MSCAGARAKRVFFTVGGGVVTRCAVGERSPLKEEYGLLCAVVRVERRGDE